MTNPAPAISVLLEPIRATAARRRAPARTRVDCASALCVLERDVRRIVAVRRDLGPFDDDRHAGALGRDRSQPLREPAICDLDRYHVIRGRTVLRRPSAAQKPRIAQRGLRRFNSQEIHRRRPQSDFGAGRRAYANPNGIDVERPAHTTSGQRFDRFAAMREKSLQRARDPRFARALGHAPCPRAARASQALVGTPRQRSLRRAIASTLAAHRLEKRVDGFACRAPPP